MATQLKSYNFKEGEVLLVDKPLNWTSFQVVNKLRWKIKHKIGVKKIKVGHAGTLDPLATGLLILCTGKFTKKIDDFMGLEKTYSGTITVGATRPSFDMETEIDQTFSTEHITPKLIKQTAETFVGEYNQMPPIFSAKKIDGKKAYDLARAGKEVNLKTKRIHISNFEITNINGNQVNFIISCSKGTYIRSIAHDFGKTLKSGAYLSALRREKIGKYSVNNAKDIEQWLNEIENCTFVHQPNH
ncbi:MAG TPA: tRNA pseudouridine(55) synthase TruB [Crocinitomix sp.]|nr:tRNA pseudouridine(55) synthase TruB [Crocinitomix sp.]